tara:strand:- start:460 stop:726 length:267 start_codon:yes stop_codon:yes gene_type:complete
MNIFQIICRDSKRERRSERKAKRTHNNEGVERERQEEERKVVNISINASRKPIENNENGEHMSPATLLERVATPLLYSFFVFWINISR